MIPVAIALLNSCKTEEKLLENYLAKHMCKCLSKIKEPKDEKIAIYLDSCSTYSIAVNKDRIAEYFRKRTTRKDDYDKGYDLGAEFVKEKVAPILMEDCKRMRELIKRYQEIQPKQEQSPN